jgi:hypothetical protein
MDFCGERRKTDVERWAAYNEEQKLEDAAAHKAAHEAWLIDQAVQQISDMITATSYKKHPDGREVRHYGMSIPRYLLKYLKDVPEAVFVLAWNRCPVWYKTGPIKTIDPATGQIIMVGCVTKHGKKWIANDTIKRITDALAAEEAAEVVARETIDMSGFPALKK